jgi:hypothetical protein
MAALLRLAAMLVAGAACLLWMRPSRLAGECHADVTPAMLPSGSSGNQTKEQSAEGLSCSIEALMVSSEQGSRPSNHEGGLTRASHILAQRQLPLSPLIPAKAGTQGSPRSLFWREAAAQRQGKPGGLSWFPAFAGTSGEKLLAILRL